MGAVVGFFNLLITWSSVAWNWVLGNPLYGGIIIFLIFLVNWRKDYSDAVGMLDRALGYSIIDGSFSRGKTRFLTMAAKQAKENGEFVLCNFYNGSEDVRWNSKADLIRLFKDMWKLGEYQNYTEADIRKMYEKEGKKRVAEKVGVMKKIARRFPNIPKNGFHSVFRMLGDEMQNIFFNRDAAGNFAGENKPLLKLLHQVRHFNGKGTFALTDADEFDKKFRRISSYYVSFRSALNGLFIVYDVYTFATNKEKHFDLEMATRLTKTSVWKLNGYEANKVINRIESLIRRRIKFRFAELDFFSKFNCDPDTDIYEEGKLFEYLEDWYKNHSDAQKFRFSN